MDRAGQRWFLLLVAAQAAHSVEEYAAGLFSVFAPAAFISSLVSSEPALGFAIVNGALVAFGVFCYLGPVRRGGPAARLWAWPWVALEGANGVGHLLLAASAGGYFPGAATAPLLLVAAGGLARRLRLWASSRARAMP